MAKVHFVAKSKIEKKVKNYNKKSDKHPDYFYIGTQEKWKLEQIEDINLTHNVIFGGKEKITEEKHNRLMIVLDGVGTVLDTKQVIREGAVIEIPAGTRLQIRSQLKYYMVTASQ